MTQSISKKQLICFSLSNNIVVSNCSLEYIPENLHQNNRPDKQYFYLGEELYRRCKKEELEKKTNDIHNYKNLINSYINNIIKDINTQQTELKFKFNELNILKTTLLTKIQNVINEIDDKETELINWLGDNHIELNVEFDKNPADIIR